MFSQGISQNNVLMNQAEKVLKEMFGHKDFLPFQRSVLEAVFQNRDVLHSQATGAGKSICNQIPAVLLDGLVLEISPLISLMRDQGEHLKKAGITYALTDSMLSNAEYEKELHRIKSGKVKLVYASPERCESQNFIEALSAVKVSRINVDEAHCVSNWGNDFRPKYQSIRNLREKLGSPPITACTATAPKFTREDIKKSLGLVNPFEMHGKITRDNLEIKVRKFESKKEKELALFNTLAQLVKKDGSIIVYCGLTRTTEKFERQAQALGINARAYHGQMEHTRRKEAQIAFTSGDAKVIFATNAFGMGIDKEDVRAVIHYNMPGSLDSYVQELGRAGRDGKPALCLLLFHYQDLSLQRAFLEGKNPSYEQVFNTHRWLYGMLPESQRNLDAPYLNLDGMFSMNFTFEYQLRAAKRMASINLLEAAGYVKRRGGFLTLITDRKEDGNFQLTNETLALKQEADWFRFRSMCEFVMSEGNPWENIENYFNKQMLSTEGQNLRDLDMLQINETDVKDILSTVRTGTYKKSEICKIVSASLSDKKRLSIDEIESKVDKLIEDGLLEVVKIKDGYSTVALTDSGSEELRGFGVNAAPETYDILMSSIHNPASRAILQEAIEQAWRSEDINDSGNKISKADLRILAPSFHKMKFNILDKEVAGDEIIKKTLELKPRFKDCSMLGLRSLELIYREFFAKVS